MRQQERKQVCASSLPPLALLLPPLLCASASGREGASEGGRQGGREGPTFQRRKEKQPYLPTLAMRPTLSQSTKKLSCLQPKAIFIYLKDLNLHLQ